MAAILSPDTYVDTGMSIEHGTLGGDKVSL